MENRPLNFALVGCGRISYKHIEAINKIPEYARIVAVCDLEESKAQAKAQELGAAAYTDYHKMLQERPDIDVITVCVPTGYHARVVIDLAQYGKHLITEKPMALSVADCEAMARAAQQNGAELFVIYQNRYNPPVQAARRALEAGRLGKLVSVTVRVRWARHQSYYDQDNWHGTWELDGGVMSQQASHHLDLLQWFLGDIKELNCRSATRLLNIEVEDTGVAILQGSSGALGVFEATVATRPSDLEGSLSILGEKGSIVINGFAVNELHTWNFQEPLPEDEGIRENVSQAVPNVYGHGHAPNLRDIVHYLRTGEKAPALVTPQEGRKNIALLTALYESAARGGETVVPGVETVKTLLGKPSAGKAR